MSLKLSIALVLLVLLEAVHAHSWVDCFSVNREIPRIESRGQVPSRNGCVVTQPGKEIDSEFTNSMTDSEYASGVPVCAKSDHLRSTLTAMPGDRIYFTYFPNGHIVKDHVGYKTQYAIYWMGNPSVEIGTTDNILGYNIVPDSTSNFDDGQCGMTTEWLNQGGTLTRKSSRLGDHIPCIGSFVVPNSSVPGLYSMAWFWRVFDPSEDYANVTKFYRGTSHPGSSYSTCFQVQVMSSKPVAEPDFESETEAPYAITPSPTTSDDIEEINEFHEKYDIGPAGSKSEVAVEYDHVKGSGSSDEFVGGIDPCLYSPLARDCLSIRSTKSSAVPEIQSVHYIILTILLAIHD